MDEAIIELQAIRDRNAKIEGSTERFIFAHLHGVPSDQRPVFIAALAGYLANELTQEEAIDLTSRIHRYY